MIVTFRRYVVACIVLFCAFVMLGNLSPASAQAQVEAPGLLGKLLGKRYVNGRNDYVEIKRRDNGAIRIDRYSTYTDVTAIENGRAKTSDWAQLVTAITEYSLHHRLYNRMDPQSYTDEIFVMDSAGVIHLFITSNKNGVVKFVQYTRFIEKSSYSPSFAIGEPLYLGKGDAVRAIEIAGMPVDAFEKGLLLDSPFRTAKTSSTQMAAAVNQTPQVEVVAAAPLAKPSSALPTLNPPTESGSRHALIVANAAYDAAFGRLANPVNDANVVAAALRRSGFTVTVVANGDQRSMKRAIAAFGQRLSAAGKGATGLFYYAGHGVQSRGINYLVPVGANIDSEADVDIEAVAADGVLRQMEEAGVSTSIVILDACRNLPIARSGRDGSRGLARMEAPNGSFVAYSTAPGSIAADGSGTNSPFAAALVAEMAKPGQQIEITFKNVRRAVMQATGGKQTPWDSSSLVDSFVFVP